MKRCPICNRTYSEDLFSFCLADGSLLSAPYDLQKTLVLQTPPPTNRESDATLVDADATPSIKTRTEGLYLEFWNGFTEHCQVTGTSLSIHKPYPQYWYSLATGRSDVGVELTASLQKKRLGCEIYLRSVNAKRDFKLLENDKQAIEEKTGALEWLELPKKKGCRIVLYRPNIDIRDKSTWVDAYTWLKAEAELFYQTFSPRIRALPR